MKILILSIFPAPYRVAVFKGIAQRHDVTLFFEGTKNGERNKAWYEKKSLENQFGILSDDEDLATYNDCVQNLKQYDLVICYDPFTPCARKLARQCIKMKIPYIINADGVVNIQTNLLKKIVKSYYVKHAKRCFAGSESAEKYFLYYGAKSQNIVRHRFTSLYSAEILKEPISIEEKNALKDKLGFERVPLFIAVGQFIPRKGFDILLRAWAEVKGDSRLVIIGGGTGRSVYEQMIADLNIQNASILDYYPHDELLERFKASDYLVMPTREDVWGLVVNEAMSVGLPVISSNKCVAANELVNNGVNGFIYDVNDFEKLAEIINGLITDDSNYVSMSNAALDAVSQYTYENIIDGHIKAIDRL